MHDLGYVMMPFDSLQCSSFLLMFNITYGLTRLRNPSDLDFVFSLTLKVKPNGALELILTPDFTVFYLMVQFIWINLLINMCL